MIANQMTAKEYCIEIKQLLQQVGEDRYVHLFDFLIEELDQEDKSSAYRKIEEMYAGMGSFSDLVLHKEGVALQMENERLAELRNGLLAAVEQQIAQQRNDYALTTKKWNDLLKVATDKYTNTHCPCAFPRFIQIVSIDCFDIGKSFSSYETEVLIQLAKPHYHTVKMEHKQEAFAERWTCKTCASEFEYLWSDLSIALSRVTLKPITIQAQTMGLPIEKTIPLFRGLSGYSFPSKNEIADVTLEEFEQYILEKSELKQEVEENVNDEKEDTSSQTESTKKTATVSKKRKKRKRPFLTAIMIFCGLFGFSFTLYLDYLDSTIGKGFLTMSLTALTAGILFESMRITKSPMFTFKLYAGTFFASFVVFITKFTNGLMIKSMVAFWPQLLPLIFGMFIGFSADDNRSTNFNRPFSMLLSLSFLYWSVDKLQLQENSILWICILLFAGLYFLFTLLPVIQKTTMSNKGKLRLSLVGISILFLFAIDYFISIGDLTIYSGSTTTAVLKYSFQYFLLGICTIFLFVNVGPLLLHMMQLQNHKKEIRFKNIVRISKIDLIKRFKDSTHSSALVLSLTIIASLVYALNYTKHFLPTPDLIWLVITLFLIFSKLLLCKEKK